MQHYFIDNINNNKIQFNKDDEHHIRHVMRFNNNDLVVCVNNNQKYLVKLSMDKISVQGEIVKPINEDFSLPVKVTIIHGLPKNDKFELALQKATELGVDTIVPFLSKRSVVKLDEKDYDKKLLRYGKIVKEASEQSERNYIPHITKPIQIKEIVNYLSELNIVADETFAHKQGTTLFDLLEKKTPKSITIIIGPEGGFSSEEFKYFYEHGFTGVSLGKRILRSETAVFYAMSCIALMTERFTHE